MEAYNYSDSSGDSYFFVSASAGPGGTHNSATVFYSKSPDNNYNRGDFEASHTEDCYFRAEDMDTGVGQTITIDNIKIEPMHSTTGVVVGLQAGFDSNSAG